MNRKHQTQTQTQTQTDHVRIRQVFLGTAANNSWDSKKPQLNHHPAAIDSWGRSQLSPTRQSCCRQP
jgi:hypothetical protein